LIEDGDAKNIKELT